MSTYAKVNPFVSLWVCVIMGLLGSFNLMGQQHRLSFQHLNIENGLTDNSINCATQDDGGFIWIGGDYGLSKFNGYSSRLVQACQKDTSEGSNLRIACVFKDSKGRMWYGSVGLILFDPISKDCKMFRHEKGNVNSLPHNDVFVIVEDEYHTIWVGTRKGLLKYNELSHDFINYVHDTIGTASEIHAKNRIIDMVADQNGSLWMTTLSGLYRFSIATKTFDEYLLDPINRTSEIENHSTFLSLDKKGSIWINYYSKGIYLFDTVRKHYERIHFPTIAMQNASKRISDLFCDSNGNTWVATTFNGVLFYNNNLKEWQHYTHDPFNITSLSDDKTTSIFEDDAGMIWIGTSSRGIDRVNLSGEPFDLYVLQPGKQFSMCENDITSFCEDKKSNLWIGTKNGLMYFDFKSNAFSCFKHDLNDRNSLSDNYIYGVDMDSSETIWIATENGLNSYNPKSKIWNRYLYSKSNPNSLPGRIAFDVEVRKNGEVWVASNSLVCRLKSKQGFFENRYNNPIIEKLRHSFYITIFEDSRKTLWLSTARAGILNVNDSFRILYSRFHTTDFKASMVHQFTEDSIGNIWMASDKGIYIWIRSSGKILPIETNDPILKGDIRSIVLASNSNLWVGTHQGLYQVKMLPDYTMDTFTRFTSSDGLQSNAFNTFAGIKLKSGALCFGGINGFNIFNPEQIRSNQYIPKVQIESFKIGNQAYDIVNQNGMTELNLNHTQNSFSFEMTSLNYNHPEKNQYAYQLVGFHENWVHTGTYRFVSINNVPPGKYTLHVTASNNDGIWNKQGRQLHITISAPYWKTNWFRSLLGLLAISIGYFIYTRRINSIKKLEQLNSDTVRQIAEARLIALRAQMNPHFIFNSLNAIQHLISESESELALRYLSKFSKLIRLILKNANKNTHTIAEELKILEYYLELESLRFSPKFSYHFDIDPKLTIDTIEIPSMLIQPFVENALVHGLLHKEAAGYVEIRLIKNEKFLICSITDNGIGREAAAIIQKQKGLVHESMAVRLSTERVDMLARLSNHKVSIEINDIKDAQGTIIGTCVTIEIPLDL